MALHRTPDSLSRCDPYLYSNPYDVRKRPDLKQERVLPNSSLPKDTIEISKDKLKEEALSRLRHTSKYVIAHQGFMRVGKYLFVAMAFPPYFVLYGLPKWILVEALPALFALSINSWQKVWQKTKKPLHAVAHQLAYRFQLVRSFAQAFIQPIVQLNLYVRKRIQHIRENILHWMSPLRNKSIFFVSLFKGASKNFKKSLAQVKESMLSRMQGLVLSLQVNMQGLKQNLLSLWKRGYSRLSSKQASFWQAFQQAQLLAQKTTLTLAAQIQQGRKLIEHCLYPLARLYHQRLLPFGERLRKACQEQWKQTRDFFHHHKQKTRAFLQEREEKLKRLSSQHLVAHILAHAWINKLPSCFQSWLKKWLSHPKIQFLLKKGIEGYAFFMGQILKGITQLLRISLQSLRLTFKVYQLLQSYVREIAQKILSAVQIGYRICRQTTYQALYYVFLSAMMLMILCTWSMQYLANRMQSFMQSLPFVHHLSKRPLKSDK